MEYIDRHEYEECVERIKDEDHRQNRRLEELEGTMKQISSLTISVEKIAISVQSLAKEIAKHSAELDALKSVPGKRWDTIITGILCAVAGAVRTAIFNGMIK